MTGMSLCHLSLFVFVTFILFFLRWCDPLPLCYPFTFQFRIIAYRWSISSHITKTMSKWDIYIFQAYKVNFLSLLFVCIFHSCDIHAVRSLLLLFVVQFRVSLLIFAFFLVSCIHAFVWLSSLLILPYSLNRSSTARMTTSHAFFFVENFLLYFNLDFWLTQMYFRRKWRRRRRETKTIKMKETKMRETNLNLCAFVQMQTLSSRQPRQPTVLNLCIRMPVHTDQHAYMQLIQIIMGNGCVTTDKHCKFEKYKRTRIATNRFAWISIQQ